MTRILLIATLSIVIAPELSAQDASKMAVFQPDEITWVEGPASLPKGCKISVLEGDPSKAGLFTMRLSFPDGYQIAPHWHTQIEHVTVISGTLNIGMGEKFDRSATRAMAPGTFGFWPAQMKHFGWAKGHTVIQLHGQGPWTITYVNPSDDPRQQKNSSRL